MFVLSVVLCIPAHAQPTPGAPKRPAETKGTAIVPDQFLRRWDPITIFFARDVGPAKPGPEDKAARFVTFSPAHPGAFTWLDARTLQFRPAEPWPPLTRFNWSVDKTSITLNTLMAAPTATLPGDNAVGLDTVDAITLSFTEPIDPRDLARMVTIELRPLPGTSTATRNERPRWLTREDFSIKTMERQSRADIASYVLALDTPIPLGTRAIVHFRLALDDNVASSFAEIAFSTAEPFRLANVGCRAGTTQGAAERRSYPIAPKGSRYSSDQALRCGNERQVLVDFSALPGEMAAVEGRNLVRFTPPVDDLSYSTEGSTLVVGGAFAWETTYRVTLEPTLIKDARGRSLDLQTASELYVYFPEPPRFVSWVAPHGVAERFGPQMVPVRGRGQERLDLRIHALNPLDRSLWPFPNQPLSLDEGQRPPGPGEEPEPHSTGEPVSAAELQRHIAALGSPSVSTIVPLPLRRGGGLASFGLDLATHLARIAGPQQPGAYLVGLRRLDSSSERSWMRLQVTDLSLTTVEEPRGVRFAVTSLSTGLPIANAQITLEGQYDGNWQTFADATTDTEGTVLWTAPGFDSRHSWEIGRITVRNGTDVLVIDPDRAPDSYADNLWSASPERWLQWAYQPLDGRGPQPERVCHIFTERPVYRPEEEVHIKGYARLRDGGALTPIDFESKRAVVVIEGPGDQVWKREVTLSADGNFYTRFAESNLPTGVFKAHLESTREERVGEVSFRMEAYRIPTFEVNMHAPDKAPLDRELEVSLTATYYAGGKVAARPVLWRVTQFPYVWSPKARAGFLYSSDARFSGRNRFESSPKIEQQDTTDEEGGARLVINPAIEPTAQPRTYVVEATVTGADDQTVTNTRHIRALPPFTLGVKVPRYLEKSEAIEPEIIVVGPDGELLPDVAVTVRLLNRQWHSILRASDFSNGVARYVTDIVDEKVSETKIVSGSEPVPVRLPIDAAGVYVVELEAQDRLNRAQVVAVDLYAGGAQPVTWAKPTTRVFEVATDKDKYNPGDTAAIVLKSPYQDARALVVVESPEGNHYEWLDVKGGSATFKQPITNRYVPRLPVHFILMRGRVAGDTPLTPTSTDLGKPATMAATAWLTVNPVDNRVDVTLENQPKARPGETIPVTVRLKAPDGDALPGEVTLWLVDQAVLALGKEQPLDPVPDFITSVKSHLTVRDTRNWAFGFLPFAEAPGGSGDGEAEGSPFDKVTVRRSFKPVPYYNPAILVGPHGSATVNVDLPDNLTNFKLRAKASSGTDRFGFAVGDLAVRLPVVVQAALPRFVRPGDTFTAAAIGRIIEGEGGPGLAAIQVDGATLSGEKQHDLVLAPDRPERIEFPVQIASPAYNADGTLERGDVTFKLALKRQSDGAGDAVEIHLPIRDDRRRVITRTLQDLQPGVAAPLPAIDESARPGTIRRTVLVSDQPGLVRMAAGLDYLLEYPYGCTEQKLSRARAYVALQAFRALLHQEGAEEKTAQPVQDFLAALPQVVDGNGLCAYWPGSRGYVSLTAWVVEFLVEARAAGFAVDSALFDKLTQALQQALRSDYGRFIDGAAFSERAWALSALASAGKGDPAYAAELARRAQYLDLEATAQVARALAMGGDSSSSTFTTLIDKMWDGVIIRLYQGHELYGGLQRAIVQNGLILPSETRTLAEMTHTVSRIDGGAARLPVLTNALVTLGRGNGWGSTNASAAALSALSGVLQPPFAGSSPHTVHIRLGTDAQTLSIGPDAPIAQIASTSADPGEATLQPGDSQAVVVARMETSYVPLADGAQVPARTSSFVVRRELLRIRPGADVPPERIALEQPGSTVALAVGDVIEDHVQVVNPSERNYVAVMVPLAAAMEPLNPQLATASSAAKPLNPLTQEPSYAQYLDDSVTFYYDTLPAGTFDFYFRTRATNAGRFIQPAAHAEMMYDESVHGNSAGALVEVGN